MSEKRRDSKGRVLKTGEYQEKDGRYSFRYTDYKGKRHTIRSWRLTNADSTPVGKKITPPLRDQEQEIQKLLLKGVSPSKLTVYELCERYLATRIEVSYNTKSNYKTVLNLLRQHEFGSRSIDKIKFSDAKFFFIRLHEEGKRYSSLIKIRNVLRPAFQTAFEDRELEYNPFNFTLSKIIADDGESRVALEPEQEQIFLDFIKNDSHYCKYYECISVLFKTGLRISEFCGLTLSDIDFNKHTLSVNKQLLYTANGEYFIIPTKTKSGDRILPITEEVENLFKGIIAKRRKVETECVIDGVSGFLYLDRNGRPAHARSWRKYFRNIYNKFTKKSDFQIPQVTPHVCRHTYCTNMVRSGINVKALQYLMGHSKVDVTLNVYTHLGLEAAQSEIERLEIERLETEESEI